MGSKNSSGGAQVVSPGPSTLRHSGVPGRFASRPQIPCAIPRETPTAPDCPGSPPWDRSRSLSWVDALRWSPALPGSVGWETCVQPLSYGCNVRRGQRPSPEHCFIWERLQDPARAWRLGRQLGALAATHGAAQRPVALCSYDHRGAGLSVVPIEQITLHGCVDDVIGVMDALRIERCIVAAELIGRPDRHLGTAPQSREIRRSGNSRRRAAVHQSQASR